MIKTIYTIGKTLAQNEEYKKYFEPWENPFEEGKVVVADFNGYDYVNGSLHIVEEKKSSNLKKYLYRKFHGGVNIVPSFTVTDGKKTFDKLVKCIEKYHFEKFGFSDIPKGKRKEAIIKKYELLKKELESFDFSSKEKYLFTIKINSSWLGDINHYVDFFKRAYLQSYYTKKYDSKEKTSQHYDYTCSILNEKKEVFGFVNVLGFTVDSVSFMRGGFSQEEAYKMFPVSTEVIEILDGSMKIALKELTRSFYGLKYMIIPHFIDRDNENAIEEALERFLNNCKDDSLQVTSNSIIYNELVLHTIAKEEQLQKSIYYDILFFQLKKAQFLIKLHLTDIIPSRLAKVFLIKEQLEKQYQKITRTSYTDKKTKEEVITDFYINFKVIKDFFSKKVKNDYVF